MLDTLRAGIRTPDVGGTAGTKEFAEAIAKRARG
jgi:isocitrate/isopropylmalate dehydrogenase